MQIKKLILNVGSQKCGTTSVDDFVRSHTNINVSKNTKELHFFDNKQKHLSDYWNLFTVKNPSEVYFESTPNYSVSSVAKRNIADISKICDVYIILLIRDPIDRIYSQYYMNVSKGVETLDINAALEEDMFRDEPFLYKSRSDYRRIYQDFCEFIPPEKITVIDISELSVVSVCEYLSSIYHECEFKSNMTFKHMNIGGGTFIPIVGRIYQSQRLRKFIKKCVGSKISEHFRRKFIRQGLKPRYKIYNEVAQEIENYKSFKKNKTW